MSVSDRTLKVAFYEGLRDVTPVSAEVDWRELVEALSTFSTLCSAPGIVSDLAPCAGRNCPAKDGPAWSPVNIDGPRADANVRAVTAAVFDLDHIASLEPVLASLSGFAYVIHSTHSHDPTDQCYRLVLPLSRPAPPEEWPRARAAIVKALELPADPQCKDLSRIYFLPSTRAGVTPYAVARDGEPIDLDEALQIAGTAPPAKEAEAPAVIDLAALRQRLSDARRSKAQGNERGKLQAAIIGRILEGEPLAPTGERDGTLLRATGLLAFWLPAETPWPAVLEVLRPSLSAMDTQPEGFDHWIEEARKKYERQVQARASQDARRAADDAAIRELVRSVANKPIATAAADLGDDWQKLLLMNGQGVKACEHNAQILVRCAPELRGTLRWNVVSNHIEVTSGPFSGIDEVSLHTAAAAWLQRHYAFLGGAALVGGALLQIARENKYDPIAEYLGEVAWDGIPRIESFFERYLGVDVADPSHAVYVRAVSKRWLIALVARALRPGCKADAVLVLEGPQGAGKSTALEALVSPAYFLDTSLSFGEKDTMQAIAGAWLVELGELASFRKAEVERVKQFITSKVDKFRPPYGHVTIESPRRCVFVGTTNADEYLVDRTGNRRYWPVYVGELDLEGIERDRDLILAEAAMLFRAGQRWWLRDEEVSLAAVETDERLGNSTLEEAIERWWYSESPAKRPKRLSMLDVSEMALHVPLDRLDRRVRTEVGIAMSRLGFRCRRRGNKERTRFYEPTPEMLDAPLRTTATRERQLALVAATARK